jgi:hypothetical protein
VDVIGYVACSVSVVCLLLLAFFGNRFVRLGIAALVGVFWILFGLVAVFAAFYGD